MARKNLLQGLMDQNTDSIETTLSIAPNKRPLKGAIGAVSQSIEALKARSLLDINPDLIDAGGLQDRLDNDDTDDAALLSSIKTYGQQVPILVRPHLSQEGRYQIVYGRRRVLAMRTLGRSVKALVRVLDDGALIMAQGQENSARKNLSFIEKANFAAQMRDAGYERKAICDALTIDKTVVSRMLLVVDRLGGDVIESIGSAPAVGRDRWTHLAELFAKQPTASATINDALFRLPQDTDSNQRFDAALRTVEVPLRVVKKDGAKQGQHNINQPNTSLILAHITKKTDKVIVTLPRADNNGFEEWLVENLDQVYHDWITSQKPS